MINIIWHINIVDHFSPNVHGNNIFKLKAYIESFFVVLAIKGIILIRLVVLLLKKWKFNKEEVMANKQDLKHCCSGNLFLTIKLLRFSHWIKPLLVFCLMSCNQFSCMPISSRNFILGYDFSRVHFSNDNKNHLLLGYDLCVRTYKLTVSNWQKAEFNFLVGRTFLLVFTFHQISIYW